jgi:lysophospholipase L1-like esterase
LRVTRPVVLLAACVIGLGIAEGLTRIFIPDPYLSFENRLDLFVEDEALGYRTRPLYRGYAQGTIRLRTDAVGYRGTGDPRVKPDKTLRILGLGDSVMWGVGVQEEDTYMRRLEEKLNGRPVGSRRIETLNGAVVGYSTHQELRALERDGLRLQPDVVLIGFVLNDSFPSEDPFFNISKFHRPLLPDIRRRPYPDLPTPPSYLYRFLRSVARRTYGWQNRPADLDLGRRGRWSPGSFEMETWPVMQEHFSRIRQVATDAGVPLLIVLFPTQAQIHDAAPRPHPQTMITEYLQSIGLPFFDLIPALLRAGETVFLDNSHFNPDGHEVVADEILNELLRRGWLSKE